MSVKEFFLSAPRFCAAPYARQWSRVNELQWDDELYNDDSVFAKENYDKDNPVGRLATAFAFESRLPETKQYCMDLGELALLSHYQARHGENWQKRIDYLKLVLSEQEKDYPEVSAVLSVEEATQGFWTPE